MAKYAETPAALVFLLGGAPARGHHSIAPYDLVHGKVINGAVTNPHAHMDVTGEENVIEHWTIELDSPRYLRRLGWTKDTVKPGDSITVTGGRAKNAGFNLRGVYVELRDGRKLLGLPGPDP